MRGYQHSHALGGTAIALFLGALCWGGLQYVQSLLRRAGVMQTPSLSNVTAIVDLIQWMVLVLVVGALFLLWNRRSHRWTVRRQEAREIRHMNIYQLADMVAEAFRYQGWSVHSNVDAEGPDLVLQKENRQSLVWCKFWRLPVTEEMVKEAITWSKTYRSPVKIVSLRAPTAAAKTLAEENNVEWIGREQILEWRRSIQVHS